MAGEEKRQIVKAQVQGKKSDGTFEDIITDDEGRLQVKDPKVGSIISYEGITDADGNPAGTTLECSDLTTKPDFDGQWVVITSGDYAGQCSDITGDTTGGTVTAHEAFDGQILSGTNFVILAMKALPAEVAAIDAKLGAFTAVQNLKAILGGYTAAAPLKAAIDAVALEATLGTHDTDIKALLTTIAGYIDTEIAAIEAKLDLPVPNVVLNTRIAEVVGNKADNAVGVVGIVASIIAYVKGILNAIAALPLAGIFHEQAGVAVNVNADNIGETTVFDLSAPGTRYLVRSLRLKCGVDPVAQTVTVRLYELINLALILVDSFDITTANWTTAHSLTDMFGLFQLAGDNLKVTVIATAVGPYAITGRYSFAMAT